MSILLTVPVLLASLCSSPTGLQDPLETSRRWYELRDIVEAARLDPSAGVDLRTHLSSAWLDQFEPSGMLDLDGERASMDAEELLEFVRAALLGAPDVEVDWIAAHAGRMALVANERAHEVAAQTLDVLREATAEAVTVDIFRIDGDQIPATTGSHLGAEAAAELVAAIPGTLVARERVRMGIPAAVSDAEWATVLYDYDVEVAQFVVASDPTVTIIRSGLEVAVRVDRAADGRRFVVRAWGRDGTLDGKPRTLKIESLGNAPIELPRVRTSLWTASAILEPGGALAIDHDGGGETALVVRVAADGRHPVPSESVIPLGELGLTPMRVAIPELEVVAPSGGHSAADDAGVFRAAPWEVEALPSSYATEIIQSELREGRAAILDSRVVLFDPTLPGDELRASVDALRRELGISTIGVDVRYDFVPAAELTRVLEDGGPLAFASKAKHRLLGSVVENDSLLLVGGVESAYLQDFDIQVAQAAVIGDPIIGGFFEGFALWCAPFRTPGGGISSWFEVRAQGGDEAIRGVATSIFVRNEKGDPSGPTPEGTFEERLWIELPVTHRASTRTRIQARDGDWSLVAARRVAETDRALVVVARMSAK